MSKERIVSYTAEELAKMRERGESRSDWSQVEAMTEDELEASIAADSDSDIPPEAWDNVTIGLPDFIESKKHINLRVDMDVWR